MPRVIIVDDREEDRYLFKSVFNLFGLASNIEIMEASSGKEAVALVKKHKPDLVLMDIRMESDRAGIDALEEIRKEPSCKGVKVWLVTSYENRGDIDCKNIESVGCDKFISRPFEQAEFLLLLSSELSVPIPERTKVKMGMK